MQYFRYLSTKFTIYNIMRGIYISILLIVSALFATSCNDKTSTPLYGIDIDDTTISCTFDRQTIKIRYKLNDGDTTSVTASTDADWILDIDTAEPGIVKVDVDVNDGDKRSTTLKLMAEGYSSAEVTISQIAAPSDTSHTLMFYFFGTSLSRYFKTNIEDAKAAISTGILGDSNRVIYLMQDSKYSARICEICYDPVNEECIERELETIAIEGEHITTDAIGANIAKMAELASANRYGIVLASHGQGWITREILNGSGGISALSLTNVWQPAIGAEVTRAFGEHNVQVNPYELAEGIAKSGVELEYILFDACFMSNIETIYDMRSSANYIIASPCEIMGKGFPYHRTLPYLFAAGGATSDVKGAAESYYKFYRDEYNNSSRCGSVAVYKCDEIEALAEATKAVIKSATEEYDSSELQTYEGQTVHQFYDFGQWVNTVATDAVALEAFNTQLENTIIAKYSLPTFYSAYGSYGNYDIDLDVYSGVTTSAPSEAYPVQWRETNWYKAVWE